MTRTSHLTTSLFVPPAPLTNLTVYVPADDAGDEDQPRDSQADPAKRGRLRHYSPPSGRGQ